MLASYKRLSTKKIIMAVVVKCWCKLTKLNDITELFFFSFSVAKWFNRGEVCSEYVYVMIWSEINIMLVCGIVKYKHVSSDERNIFKHGRMMINDKFGCARK